VEYIRVIVNQTGEYYYIPCVEEFLNLTYKNIKLNLFWKDTCLYVSTLYYDRPAEVYVDVYGLTDDYVAQYVTTLRVYGTATYCNNTLENYTYLMVTLRYPDGEVVGPIALYRPTLLRTIVVPAEVAPYIPFIICGVILFAAMYFNIRKMAAGLLALAALSPWLIAVLVAGNSVLYNPLLTKILPALVIFLAGLLIYLAERHWEA